MIILIIISCFKLCFTSELWKSGIIFDEKNQQINSPGIFESILQPIFGTNSYEECDNFVQVTLPVNKRFKRILFVTPGIAKSNPEGVKETFFRLYCNLIGILLRGRELIKFKSGTFFPLKPLDSRLVLRSYLNEFERNFGIKLFAAMIDSGPDELSYSLKQEFINRGIELFRHPTNMINGEIYYIIPVPTIPIHIMQRNEEIEEYYWERDPLLKGKYIFKIIEKYSPIIPEILVNKEHKVENEIVPDTNEIIKSLENIYGPLEEISLEEAVDNVYDEGDFYLKNLFNEKEEVEEEKIDLRDDDKEYEIIKLEDFKYYW